MMKLVPVAVVASLTLAVAAHAATFDQESGFGPASGFSSCKSVVNTAAFATGAVLTSANVSGPCVGYYGVTLDTTLKTITFTGLEFGNYSAGTFDITGITGETITGLTTLSYAGLFAPTYYTTPTGAPSAAAVPVPVLGFTADSISIAFNVAGQPDPFDQFTYDGNGGQAVFAYTSDADVADVPEPSTWAMMLAGFGTVGVVLRRRERTTVRYA